MVGRFNAWPTGNFLDDAWNQSGSMDLLIPALSALHDTP